MTETIGENDRVEMVGNTFRKVTPKGDFGLGLGRLATFGMLPTPTATDIQHKRRVQELKDAGGQTMASRKNGASRPNGLSDFIHFYGILPTPTAIEGVKWTNTWNPNSQMGQSLSAMAGSGMLPTPAARDHKQDIVDEKLAKRAETHQIGMPEVIANLATSQDSDDGQTSRLSPLFTEEMMGFPFLWTTLPFLRQNGEQKA